MARHSKGFKPALFGRRLVPALHATCMLSLPPPQALAAMPLVELHVQVTNSRAGSAMAVLCFAECKTLKGKCLLALLGCMHHSAAAGPHVQLSELVSGACWLRYPCTSPHAWLSHDACLSPCCLSCWLA